MKKIKTQQLAALLKPAEKRELSAYLNSSKRPVQARLFDAICRSKLKQEPIQWFQACFDEAYHTDKDYLLRNELRHLGNELITYLVGKEIPAYSTNKSLVYLGVLQKRGNLDLLESELQRILKQAKTDGDPGLCFQLLKMRIDQDFLHKETTPDNYTGMLKDVDEALQILTQYYEQQYLQLWRKRATLQRTLKAMGRHTEIEPVQAPSFNWDDIAENTANARFQLLHIQAAQSSGIEKIALLQEAVKLVNDLDDVEVDVSLETASCAAAIALEYFLMGMYEESMPYHEQALSFADKLEPVRAQAFLFNHLSTLIRMEHYEDAVSLLEEHSPIWLKSKRLKDRTLCMKAMCHLFLNEPEAAAGCLPDHLKDSGLDHYYYYRVIQILVYTQRGDHMLALNEADNFLDTIKYQSVDDDHKELVQFIKRYLKLENDKVALAKYQYQVQLDQLKSEFIELMEHKAHPHNYLLYKWVESKLARG